MPWFDSIKSPKLKTTKKVGNDIPSGLWQKCSSCMEIIQTSRLEENNQVCPFCEHHFRLSAEDRVKLLVDADSFKEEFEELGSLDPFCFKDKKNYDERLKEVELKTGRKDGTLIGKAKIEDVTVYLVVMDFKFMGGSMGVVTGEKIALAAECALSSRCPLIIVSCSGGARMQEGILSLMQMAKTSGALSQMRQAGIPYISILTDPTTGGVAASFALLGDVILAEPKALIGFAGPRVIEQSLRQTLPEGFQKSEFLLAKGLIDAIVHRNQLRSRLGFFVKILQPKSPKS